ncbi:MAG: ATP-binding cassette domain-containing protein [Gammaproteobacteria bacterium]|nr:ATP-binding cassette domain-containing protein [Gammaproteobacteria bacterium]
MIRVKGLTKVFASGTKALDGLDLEVESGEIMALLGPNGAGKTTAIRVLSTLSGFDAGEVISAGYNVDSDGEKVRQSIGVVAQQTGVDYLLTGRENMMLQGRMYRMTTNDIKARIDELASYFDLNEALDRLVSTYSGGMRRKLDIATALIHRPQLVFLDEPTLGLDIKSRKMLWAYIEKLNKELGLTILLTTHYLEEADNLSHRVSIICAGKIRVVGTPEELKSGVKGDSVILEFENSEPATQAAANALGEQDFIKEKVWEGNKLRLYVENGSASVARIAQAAADNGVVIKSLSLSQPSLDDVYLIHTGTSFESNEEEGADEWWKQWAGKGGGGGKWSKQWDQQEDDAGGDASLTDGSSGEAEANEGSNEGSKEKPSVAQSTDGAAEQPWPQQSEWKQGDDAGSGQWGQGEWGKGDWSKDGSGGDNRKDGK